MEIVRWSDRFSVGNQEIDQQHKMLFNFINYLAFNSGKANNRRETTEILEKLIAYTEYHFSAEEAFLEGHPTCAAHRAAHAEFIDRTRLFKKAFMENREEINGDLFSFLVKWLRDHILATDRLFFKNSHHKTPAAQHEQTLASEVEYGIRNARREKTICPFAPSLSESVRNMRLFSKGSHMMWVKILVVMLFLATTATAAETDWSSLQPSSWDTPFKGTKGTFLDAARHIFPGAILDESKRLVLTRDKILRMPGTSKDRAVLPEKTTLAATFFPRTVRSQGKQYTVLLWDGLRPENSEDGGWEEGVAVIAVFPEGSAEPTDVAEVKQDQQTSLGDLVNLGAEDALTVWNTHSNSSQGYALTDLFHIRDGRLRRITDSLFTLTGNSGCANSFHETLSWRIDPDGVTPPRITAVVTLTHAPADFIDENCVPMPRSWDETFTETHRWNKAKGRYTTEGGSMDRLRAWNENNL